MILVIILVITCIVMIILIFYFIYLLIKFSGTEKPEFNINYFRDKEYIKYPPIIVGYLYNKKVKEEYFIATILDFVCKGYIKLEKSANEKDYIFTVLKKIKTSPIESYILKIFFNKDFLDIGVKQSLLQFKKIMKNEKRFGNLGRIKRNISTAIREEFDSKEEVKKITRSTNIKNILICYILFLVAFIFLAIENGGTTEWGMTLGILTFNYILFSIGLLSVKEAVLGVASWSTAIIIMAIIFNTFLYVHFLPILFLLLAIIAVIILFDDTLQRKKTKLANATEMIKGLRRYIIDYSNIKEYDLERVYLWDEYYIYAIVLNVKKLDNF